MTMLSADGLTSSETPVDGRVLVTKISTIVIPAGTAPGADTTYNGMFIVFGAVPVQAKLVKCALTIDGSCDQGSTTNNKFSLGFAVKNTVDWNANGNIEAYTPDWNPIPDWGPDYLTMDPPGSDTCIQGATVSFPNSVNDLDTNYFPFPGLFSGLDSNNTEKKCWELAGYQSAPSFSEYYIFMLPPYLNNCIIDTETTISLEYAYSI